MAARYPSGLFRIAHGTRHVLTDHKLGRLRERLPWPSCRSRPRCCSARTVCFGGIYLADQFLLYDPPDCPALELVVTLNYLRGYTERVRFGPIVAPSLSAICSCLLAKRQPLTISVAVGCSSDTVPGGWSGST